MRGLLWVALVTLIFGSAAASAKPASVSAGKVESELKTRSRLRAILREKLDIEIVSLKASPLADFFDVRLADGATVLINRAGSHLIAGELYALHPNGLVNLSERNQERWRRAKLGEIKRRDMIVFSPTGPAKAGITVFTDVDCGYCRRLHQEVPILNRKGIEVRYLAFPRAGVGSDTYRKMVSAWCSANPQVSMTQLKNGRPIPIKLCAGNPVADQLNLGQTLGVRGTPALITDDGMLMPGYVPAEELARRLGVK